MWGVVGSLGLLAALFAFVPGSSAQAAPPDALEVNEALGGEPLGPITGVYIDRDAKLGLQDVQALPPGRFVRGQQETASLGFTDAAAWFRLVVTNPGTTPRRWLLEVGYPHLDQLDLYGPSAAGTTTHRRAGDSYPFHERDFNYRNVVFDVHTPPGTHVYHLRVRSSGPMVVPLAAWSLRGFLDHVSTQYPPLWMFYGVMGVMALYNLFVYFAVRQLPYLYYVLYILAFTLFQLTLNGLSFQYLWPNAPAWANRFSPTSIGLAFAMGVQFMRHFLEYWRYLPRADRFARALGLYGGLFVVVAAQVAPVWLSVRLAILMGVGVIIVVVPGISSLALRGHRQARYYLAAWGLFFAGILLYLFRSLGIVPANGLTEWTIQAGAALEVVLLSLGLADRINVMRRDLGRLNVQLERNVVELTAALDQARQAQEAKSAFLASVSHELRTPLNAIINIPEGLLERCQVVERARCRSCHAEFALDVGERVDETTACPDCSAQGMESQVRLETGGDPREVIESLRLSHRAGRHLLDVVSDILDISKLEAGKMVVHPERVEVCELTRETLEPMVAVADTKGTGLVMDLEPEPCFVDADPIKLRQVLLNLVSNAIKFSEGRGTVHVRVRREPERVLISVHDEGIGISAADQARIFDRFAQADARAVRRFGGTGLGLSISKQLVELHGGSLWCESELGRGSDFYVALPTTRTHAPGAAA